MQRLEAVRQAMKKENLPAILVTYGENRAYLCGFTGSSGTVLITPEQAYLVVGFIYQEQASMQAPGWNIISQRESPAATVGDLLGSLGIKEVGFEANHCTHAQLEGFQKAFSEANLEITLTPYRSIIETLRQVKDADEIALIAKAAEIADHAYLHILGVIRAGISEKDVAIELEYTLKKMGADTFAFDTIVVSGKRSSMPHGKPTTKIIQVGDFVTMDYGARYGGYCSDITRTVVVGKPSDEQRRVYQTVLTAHLRSYNAAAPGISGVELDAVARNTINDAGYGKYFGHSLGHGIGRVVHEGPSASQRSEAEFVAGNVVTIEPGIYIPNWGGVRIEDTVLITEEGRRSLNHTTKELIVL
ncbi:MAG: aminopeptidase P family protein [Symbiobacteriaceae bacterium]|nr:aminopeptidase P family protein [Symbiobacteriaceae bacterium]